MYNNFITSQISHFAINKKMKKLNKNRHYTIEKMHNYHSRTEVHVRIGPKGGKKIDPGETFKETR